MRWDEMLGKKKCWKQLRFCTHTFVHFMDLQENVKHIQMRQQMINTKLHILFQKLQILVNWMFVHKFWNFHKINHFGIVALWCHNLNNMTITLKIKKKTRTNQARVTALFFLKLHVVKTHALLNTYLHFAPSFSHIPVLTVLYRTEAETYLR